MRSHRPACGHAVPRAAGRHQGMPNACWAVYRRHFINPDSGKLPLLKVLTSPPPCVPNSLTTSGRTAPPAEARGTPRTAACPSCLPWTRSLFRNRDWAFQPVIRASAAWLAARGLTTAADPRQMKGLIDSTLPLSSLLEKVGMHIVWNAHGICDTELVAATVEWYWLGCSA